MEIELMNEDKTWRTFLYFHAYFTPIMLHGAYFLKK